MTLKDAEKIVQQYASVLARDTPDGGLADSESRLPHPGEKIIEAMKLWLAHDIQNRSLTEEFCNELGTAAARLPHFFEDEQARRMNAVLDQPAAVLDQPALAFKREAMELLLQASLTGASIRSELRDFVSAVQQFDLDDPLYYQRVYTLAGVEYAPARNRSSWEWFS